MIDLFEPEIFEVRFPDGTVRKYDPLAIDVALQAELGSSKEHVLLSAIRDGSDPNADDRARRDGLEATAILANAMLRAMQLKPVSEGGDYTGAQGLRLYNHYAEYVATIAKKPSPSRD